MKAAFHTLGCKVNQYETEALKETFRSAGYDIADENDIADIYVINTCTVTGLADRKSRQYIRRMKKLNPDSCIAVTGCYAQLDPDEVSRIPGVNIVAGTNEKQELLKYIEEYTGGSPEIHISKREELKDYIESSAVSAMGGRTRAYIKIQEGCDRFCSYCAIPYARGPVRSRDHQNIVSEAEQLVKNGFKELILTGINTALYGSDRGDGSLLMADLLADLEKIPGDFRIRLSSVEPTVADPEYVKKLFGSEKLCHSMHLSLQSGSDRILRAMNRRYSRSDYMEIVKTLRDHDPYYGISTDIISGFPGETEKDLDDSIDIIKRSLFCKVHAFRFSKRNGTPAAQMEGQIPPEIKKRRNDELLEAGKSAAESFFMKNIGRIERVLIEEDGSDGDHMSGYTDNFIRVYVPYEAGSEGKFLHVKLTGLFRNGMKGIEVT